MRCAYEPTITMSAPWTPKGMRTRGEELSTCPGYSTSLPMVGEVVEAYPHWEAGTLADLIGGAPSRAMLLGLSALKAGHAERSRDILDERKAGG